VRPGDGTPPDVDDELVAQIIPLRRRDQASATQTLNDGRTEPSPRTTNLASPTNPALPAERSVWDQPTTELRRRTPASTRAGMQERWSRPWTTWRARSVKVAATVLATALCVGLLELSLGALRGGSAPAPKPTRASAAAGISGGNRPALGTRSSSRPSVSSSRGRPTHQTRRDALPRADNPTGAEKRAAPTPPAVELAVSNTSAAARSGDTAAGSAVENAPAPAESPAPSHDSAPALAQSQCVPGELGC
jgi:hypothetical protein